MPYVKVIYDRLSEIIIGLASVPFCVYWLTKY